MAYYHKKDNGKIIWLRPPRPWIVKCSKCSKRWPTSVLFRYPPPSDMTRYVVEKKGEPSYAKWGDRIPFVNVVASKLPNWPRWARILVLLVLVAIVVIITLKLRGC